MFRPTYMMKRKGFVLCLVLAVVLLLAGFAAAETTDPIVASMELTPGKLTGPGPVTVTITISNSSDQDLKDPVVLYDPAAQIVSDFGTNGSAMLKAGESRTWTGTYDVNQRTLDNGFVVYYVKYTLYQESGKAVEQSQPIRQSITQTTAEADIEVKRTITPTIAREGQSVVVRYDISNTGTVALLNVGIQENSDIFSKKQNIPRLEPGQTAEIKYPVTMGTRDLTSSCKITYTPENQNEEQTYTVNEQVIRFGEPQLTATLSANAKGVVQNGTVKLTLTLKNSGSVDYSDIRVSDASLGDVFTNQELKAGKTLELSKEVTVPATTDYQFVVSAVDATGGEATLSTEVLSITAVSPEHALTLEAIATPDRTEVYEQPAKVRFTLAITNNSRVDATNVKVSHGDVDLYTFTSIPAGETRTMSRDFALSMQGKYRFTVTAQDPLEGTQTFQSNETQIVFSVPTPAPATPTPAPAPTPEPTFSPATVPPITDRSVGTFAKIVQTILLPLLILSGVVLIATVVLLIIAAKRRNEQKKASEAAVDQLERAERRDYITPVDEDEEAAEETEVQPAKTAVTSKDEKAEKPAYELPHLKYARNARAAEAVQEAAEEPSADTAAEEEKTTQQDDDLSSWDDIYKNPNTAGKPVYEDAAEEEEIKNEAAEKTTQRPLPRSRRSRSNQDK